ncbi:MAG: hypothetical protein ABSH41_05955 [Syntrophobacteraceae bacterium]
MKLIAKFAVTIFALTFVFATAYIANAGEAHHLMGQGTGKAVSSDNQNTQASIGPAAPGPYKYNYNQRHGITNDFGQDKAGNPNTV